MSLFFSHRKAVTLYYGKGHDDQHIAGAVDGGKQHDKIDSLGKANAQMRGLKATFLPKQSEKQTAAAPKTDEQKAAEESARKAAIKARGNNGARRRDYFTVDTVEWTTLTRLVFE